MKSLIIYKKSVLIDLERSNILNEEIKNKVLELEKKKKIIALKTKLLNLKEVLTQARLKLEKDGRNTTIKFEDHLKNLQSITKDKLNEILYFVYKKNKHKPKLKRKKRKNSIVLSGSDFKSSKSLQRGQKSINELEFKKNKTKKYTANNTGKSIYKILYTGMNS